MRLYTAIQSTTRSFLLLIYKYIVSVKAKSKETESEDISTRTRLFYSKKSNSSQNKYSKQSAGEPAGLNISLVLAYYK